MPCWSLLAALLAVAPPAGADDAPAAQVRVQERPADPGSPSEALKSFEARPDAEERGKRERDNPDPLTRSLVPLAAGGAALVLPFLGWLAFAKRKGDGV